MTKKLRISLETALFLGFVHLIRSLGLKRGNRVFGSVCVALGRRTKTHRKARANIAMIFPDKSSDEVERIAREVWRQFGCLVNEICQAEQTRDPAKVTFENSEIYEKARAEGRGVILASGHISNYDMLIYFMEYMEEDGIVFMRGFNHPGVLEWLIDKRADFGGDIEYCSKTKEATHYLRGELARGRSVMLLSDQRKATGVPTTFLGRQTTSPVGPASLAWENDVPIVICAVSRGQNDHFTVRFEERITWTRSGNKSDDIANIIQRLNDVLSDIIRRDPAQWFWLHDRWKVKNNDPATR